MLTTCTQNSVPRLPKVRPVGASLAFWTCSISGSFTRRTEQTVTTERASEHGGRTLFLHARSSTLPQTSYMPIFGLRSIATGSAFTQSMTPELDFTSTQCLRVSSLQGREASCDAYKRAGYARWLCRLHNPTFGNSQCKLLTVFILQHMSRPENTRLRGGARFVFRCAQAWCIAHFALVGSMPNLGSLGLIAFEVVIQPLILMLTPCFSCLMTAFQCLLPSDACPICRCLLLERCKVVLGVLGCRLHCHRSWSPASWAHLMQHLYSVQLP